MVILSCLIYLVACSSSCPVSLCVRYEEATDKLKAALETEPHVAALRTLTQSKLCHCYSKVGNTRGAACTTTCKALQSQEHGGVVVVVVVVVIGGGGGGSGGSSLDVCVNTLCILYARCVLQCTYSVL